MGLIVDTITNRGDIHVLFAADTSTSMNQGLSSENCYEYVDLLCSGIDQKLFENSGFKLHIKDDNLIVPTYFEPFVDKNIDIYFEKSHKDLIIFKGDSDGDRPSIAKSIKKVIN